MCFRCLWSTAKIGPPGLQVESEDGNVKINILHPEANQARKMWDMDNLSYKLAIWKNSSSPEVLPFNSCTFRFALFAEMFTF